MTLINEKGAFSKRLTRLLNEAGIGTASPTSVAREFNRRYSGTPVSAQAVRKWINGDSIPAGDKIRTLAKWLKTSPHWLHYGESESSVTVLELNENRGTYDEEAIATLPEDYGRLTPKHKIMVCEIVQALLLAQKR